MSKNLRRDSLMESQVIWTGRSSAHWGICQSWGLHGRGNYGYNIADNVVVDYRLDQDVEFNVMEWLMNLSPNFLRNEVETDINPWATSLRAMS